MTLTSDLLPAIQHYALLPVAVMLSSLTIRSPASNADVRAKETPPSGSC